MRMLKNILVAGIISLIRFTTLYVMEISLKLAREERIPEKTFRLFSTAAHSAED